MSNIGGNVCMECMEMYTIMTDQFRTGNTISQKVFCSPKQAKQNLSKILSVFKAPH